MTSNVQRRRRRSENSSLKKVFKFLRPYLRWQFLLTGFVVIFIVAGLVFWVLISDAVAQLQHAQDGLSRVVTSISETSGTELTLNDFNRLEVSIDELSERIQTARGRLGLLGPLLNLNADWKAVSDSLSVAGQLCDSALDMLAGLEPALNFMVQGNEDELVTTGISSGERLTELLDLGEGRFLTAQNSLRLAEAQLNEMDLSNVSPQLILRVENLRSYHSQLSGFNTVLLNSTEILTSIMGLDGQNTFLVLAQNNDEIRPSGGYISTYGWFTVDSGRITDFDYHPTTTTSPNPPDDEFLSRFEIPSWWIHYGEPIYAAWDGSWYADFPSTAQLAMDYYNAGGNPHSPVDGVLAIDITGFELLLSAFGEVAVPEYDVIITPENFRSIVYDIRAYGQGDAHKDFVADVYAAIFEAWRNIDQSRLPVVLGALLEASQSRHLMIYFADAELNNVIGTLGWNGALASGIGYDYLLVADANLGNKSNHSIIRSMTYDVTISAEGMVNSVLSLNYEYFDAVASLDPAVDADFHGPLLYNNLMQVFLPQEASLMSSENLETELIALESHSLFVGRSSVAYDSSERYRFEYETPNLIDSFGNYQRYRLLIQKQAGAQAEQLNIQIRLPEGASLVSSNPGPDENYTLDGLILDYRIEIDGDFWLEIVYQN